MGQLAGGEAVLEPVAEAVGGAVTPGVAAPGAPVLGAGAPGAVTAGTVVLPWVVDAGAAVGAPAVPATRATLGGHASSLSQETFTVMELERARPPGPIAV